MTDGVLSFIFAAEVAIFIYLPISPKNKNNKLEFFY